MIHVIKSGRGRFSGGGGLVGTEWAVIGMPVGNTQAVAVRAAAASLRHVATGISATISAGVTAAGQLDVVLRDGATGVGPIVWAQTLRCPASDIRGIVQSGLKIPGSTNTAMTLEFSAAGGAGTLERVSLSGFDVV